MTAQEAINSLPKNLDDLVKHLISLDCKGIKGSHWCCPIANYLTIKNVFFSTIESNIIKFHKDGFENYKLPFHICEFIRNFDEGKYPELIATHRDLPQWY